VVFRSVLSSGISELYRPSGLYLRAHPAAWRAGALTGPAWTGRDGRGRPSYIAFDPFRHVRIINKNACIVHRLPGCIAVLYTYSDGL
jgi:hypothetical protein